MFRWFSMVLALAIIATMNCPAFAVPPPDNSSSRDRADVKDSIIATMDDVDDIGLLFLWSGNPQIEKIGYCEWQGKGIGGDPGSTTVRVDQKLNKGTNYLVFVLYNQIFSGPFGGGKWSYDFKLKKNTESVWRKSDLVREKNAEIKYWKVFKLDVAADGAVAISEEIPKESMDVLKKFMTELENALVEKAPRKTVTVGSVIGEVLKEY